MSKDKRLVLIYGIVLALFLYFIWPTPYIYHRHSGNVIRVDRFTGVKEFSTSEGWRR